jgi:hypothetical protein
MAQRLTTSFVNTNIPGAYPNVTVKSTPVGITNTGDIVIIGEAEGGADYTAETLKDNFFTPTQLDRVRSKYLRGPIVDAMAALTSPSNDTDITGSVGRVYIVKTNGGTKASGTVPASPSGTYGTFTDKNYGTDGNKYYYQTTQVEDEVGPSLQGSELTIGDGSIFDGLSFDFRGNGGVETTITLSGTSTDHDTIVKLATEIDGQLPADFSCEAASGVDALVFKSDADADANGKGYGKSFELVDSTPGDLVVIGFTESLTVSSQEPEVEFTVIRQDTNTNESFVVEAEVALTMGYDGTTGTASISGGTLTTTVTGGSGTNLSIELADYTTIADLATYISSQAGYSATSVPNSNTVSPSNLDEVSAIGICTSNSFEAGRIKKSVYNVERKLSESSVVDFAFTATGGLPAEMATAQFLTGGTKGATTAADIVNAIPSLEGIKVNFVNPLFSRDASDDIADGLTDSGSTYTIDAINFAIKSHVLAMSTVKLKRNRVAMLSKYGTYAEVKSHAQTLASFRSTLCFQKTSQTNSVGEVVEYFPWHTAAVATGMQSAGFYKAITNKFANVISFKDPSGFDSGNPGDVEDAIDAGTMFLQSETSGVKWVVDQTTYGFDSNFVYNSLQAVYMSDVLAIQLAESLERFAVGKSLADINVASMAGHIAKKMEEYRKLKIIGPSDDAPLGYKNLDIQINGPIAEVKLEAKLATQILFIPIELELSQIQSSTSA